MTTRAISAAPEQWERSQVVTLDGQDFEIVTTYRQRVAGGSFYVSLLEADGTPIVQGRRVSPGASPLAGLVAETLPAGALVSLGIDPYRRDDYGQAVRLLYVPAADLPVPAPQGVSYSL